jgi:hypothetical protein
MGVSPLPPPPAGPRWPNTRTDPDIRQGDAARKLLIVHTVRVSPGKI